MNASWLVVAVLMGVMPAETVIHRHRQWNPPQFQFLNVVAEIGGPLEEVDFEGAVRAGKSTPAGEKLAYYVKRYPGIHTGATRWTQDGLDAQVKPLWRDIAGFYGLTLRWHSDEEYDEVVGTGSRVYLRALKASEGTNRYGKLAGLTLAVLWMDQPEEIPEDVIDAYVPARLSQVGFPHEAWYTPNPPAHGHWLASRFPEDNSTPHRTYIRTTVYDNRHNLGEEYIAGLERAYPVGTVLRRRFIEGKRGLSVSGKPVYGGYYDPARHCQPLEMNPALPLYEGFDFGTHRPCVGWAQFTPWGSFHLLGAIMGEDIYLEDFVPLALMQRAQWFPRPLDVLACCDPAGAQANSLGSSVTGVRALADLLGYTPRSVATSNTPDVRSYTIQTQAAYMRRRAIKGGEAFQIDPVRWRVIGQQQARSDAFGPDGFEAGYVWDDRVVRTAGGKPIQVPKKDGYYDHFQNVCEYLIANFGPAMPTQKDEQTIERQILKRAQQDLDPDDRAGRRGGRHIGGIGSRGTSRRGGY
jgi:hypothetical protein